MNEKTKTRIGRKLSLVLRHQPEAIGITLDKNGWTSVPDLLHKLEVKGINLTFDDLVDIVETNSKQRYSFNEDRSHIRANQGHSLKNVDVELKVHAPPDELFHGTATRFLDSIMAGGLDKRNRQHVHLSTDPDTALQVGARHGKVAILLVDASAMHRAGHVFYQSVNGVWLTDCVPVEFLENIYS